MNEATEREHTHPAAGAWWQVLVTWMMDLCAQQQRRQGLDAHGLGTATAGDGRTDAPAALHPRCSVRPGSAPRRFVCHLQPGCWPLSWQYPCYKPA